MSHRRGVIVACLAALVAGAAVSNQARARGRQRDRLLASERPMSRSIVAVLFGTFTLRFSTGLTTGLLVYYLAGLESYGADARGSPPSRSAT
jgi:hypothetical protein